MTERAASVFFKGGVVGALLKLLRPEAWDFEGSVRVGWERYSLKTSGDQIILEETKATPGKVAESPPRNDPVCDCRTSCWSPPPQNTTKSCDSVRPTQTTSALPN